MILVSDHIDASTVPAYGCDDGKDAKQRQLLTIDGGYGGRTPSQIAVSLGVQYRGDLNAGISAGPISMQWLITQTSIDL